MTEVRSALPPTEAELAAWRALSRDAQPGRYWQALRAPAAGRVSAATMAELLTVAWRRVASRGD